MHKLFIDTGGTFTDAIAILPEGKIERRKILSSGRLRGQIISFIDETHLLIQENWSSEIDIFNDFTFSTLEKVSHSCKVVSYDVKNHILEIGTEIKSNAKLIGLAFELYTGEEALVVAARL